MIVRGCGTRVVGGVYLETKLHRFGRPIWDFVMDPPVAVDVDAMGIAPRGVSIIERAPGTGIYDVWDWVGASNYPNVVDLITEMQRYGVSRRVSGGDALHLLTNQSRLMLVHPRGWIKEWERLAASIVDAFVPPREQAFGCPTTRAHRIDAGIHCCRLWWHDVREYEKEATRVEEEAAQIIYGDHRRVTRQMPTYAYSGFATPRSWQTTHWPAVVASLPIGQISIIRDAYGQTHVRLVEQLGRTASLPVQVEDE